MIRMRVADSGFRLSFEERELVEEMLAAGHSRAEIARATGRARSTICREVARNHRGVGGTQAGRPGLRPYAARIAQVRTEDRARRPKPTKLSRHRVLAATVQAWLGGSQRMSPQQVSHRLRVVFPDDGSMRVSHETLYTELYVQGRGSLRKDLHTALRTGRARRAPRTGATRPRVPGELLIANR
ncbi:IS30 family transposase, partial [Phycicoccus sp. BSK3Z-2]